ncbi:MAG: carboxypeptidase regulatory-like domain-containing protein [Bacteroidales bacterium]|nr:carboxypeptidase regulatory-like domain-containing protein [Bacteroidales bacterium]
MIKKSIYIVIAAIMLLSSCKKVDIFDYELPSGRMEGFLKDEATGSPVKDIYIIITDTLLDAYHMVYSKADGYYTLGRLATGTYSVVPTNDSVYCATDVFIKVTDGETVKVPDMLLRPTAIPVLTMNLDSSVIATTKNSFQLQTWVDHGHSTVVSRGYKYLKATDTRDPRVSGSTKSASTSASSPDIITLDMYSTTLTSLSANTTYKIVSFVTIYRGLTSTGTRKTVYVYSDNEILVTTPAS